MEVNINFIYHVSNFKKIRYVLCNCALIVFIYRCHPVTHKEDFLGISREYIHFTNKMFKHFFVRMDTYEHQRCLSYIWFALALAHYTNTHTQNELPSIKSLLFGYIPENASEHLLLTNSYFLT